MDIFPDLRLSFSCFQEPNQSSASVQFEPSFTDVSAALVNCLAIIVLSVEKIPRVESKLFMDKDVEE